VIIIIIIIIKIISHYFPGRHNTVTDSRAPAINGWSYSACSNISIRWKVQLNVDREQKCLQSRLETVRGQRVGRHRCDRLPLLCAGLCFIFPAAEQHCPLASTKLYCLVKMMSVCFTELPVSGYIRVEGRELNPASSQCKSSIVTVASHNKSPLFFNRPFFLWLL